MDAEPLSKRAASIEGEGPEGGHLLLLFLPILASFCLMNKKERRIWMSENQSVKNHYPSEWSTTRSHSVLISDILWRNSFAKCSLANPLHKAENDGTFSSYYNAIGPRSIVHIGPSFVQNFGFLPCAKILLWSIS